MGGGRTVGELLAAMSDREFGLWKAYRARNGFAADRIEGAIAINGSYVGRSRGGRAKPSELLPTFGGTRRPRTHPKVLLAYLTSIPGAKVTRYGK